MRMRSRCSRSILAERRCARRAFPRGQPPADVAAAAPLLVTLARATASVSRPPLLLASALLPCPSSPLSFSPGWVGVTSTYPSVVQKHLLFLTDFLQSLEEGKHRWRSGGKKWHWTGNILLSFLSDYLLYLSPSHSTTKGQYEFLLLRKLVIFFSLEKSV